MGANMSVSKAKTVNADPTVKLVAKTDTHAILEWGRETIFRPGYVGAHINDLTMAKEILASPKQRTDGGGPWYWSRLFDTTGIYAPFNEEGKAWVVVSINDARKLGFLEEENEWGLVVP